MHRCECADIGLSAVRLQGVQYPRADRWVRELVKQRDEPIEFGQAEIRSTVEGEVPGTWRHTGTKVRAACQESGTSPEKPLPIREPATSAGSPALSSVART